MLFFKKKSSVEETEDNILLGVNLSKYHYLGYSEFYYTDTERRWQCHYFISNDERKRIIKITGNNSSDLYKYHPYYNKTCLLWQAGEREWYSHATDYQSTYMTNRMLEEYGVVWSSEKKWWVDDDQARYDHAQSQQKEKNKPTSSTDDNNNVVKINFTKDKN